VSDVMCKVCKDEYSVYGRNEDGTVAYDRLVYCSCHLRAGEERWPSLRRKEYEEKT